MVAPDWLLLNAAQLAELLGVSTRTVWQMRSTGRIPSPIKLGPQTVRWRRADIEQWLDELKPE